LFEAKSENDGLDNSLSDSDDWGLIAADLIVSDVLLLFFFTN
jgi:hypothetical protein